jgi:uncharacterized coiled-coil protein SlyX
MGSSNVNATELSERLTKLEESETFAQRTVEELNGEVIELNRRLADALSRLERLEARLDTVAADERGPAPETDRPPPPPELRD